MNDVDKIDCGVIAEMADKKCSSQCSKIKNADNAQNVESLADQR